MFNVLRLPRHSFLVPCNDIIIYEFGCIIGFV